MKKSMKITANDIYKMERTARRNIDIECEIPRLKHKKRVQLFTPR